MYDTRGRMVLKYIPYSYIGIVNIIGNSKYCVLFKFPINTSDSISPSFIVTNKYLQDCNILDVIEKDELNDECFKLSSYFYSQFPHNFDIITRYSILMKRSIEEQCNAKVYVRNTIISEINVMDVCELHINLRILNIPTKNCKNIFKLRLQLIDYFRC